MRDLGWELWILDGVAKHRIPVSLLFRVREKMELVSQAPADHLVILGRSSIFQKSNQPLLSGQKPVLKHQLSEKGLKRGFTDS